MIPAILDHLWQSTLVALAAGLLALTLPRARASVRFGLWLAASLKFLVPFATLAALGRRLAPAVRPPVAATSDAAIISPAVAPFSLAQPVGHAEAAATHAAPSLDPTLVLLGLWPLGAAAVLIVWGVRWAKVREALREAKPLALGAPMPVLVSPWMREPGLVGLLRPVLLVPEALFDHLSQSEIAAIVAHEACHMRRRDNLTAAIHMLVEAIFWFHPLVWWIGQRLIAERERACDEAVIGSGHDRASYARSLIESSRLYLRAPLPCVAGASGSNLKTRVVMIMTAPKFGPLSGPKKILLLAAGACALATPVAAGWLTSPEGHRATAPVTALASNTVGLAQPAASGAPATPQQARDIAKPIVPADTQATSPSTAAVTLAEAAPAAERTQPLPGVQDAIRRWIEKTQLHQADTEDMSSALAEAARAQAQMTMQTLSAFGPLKSVRFVRATPEGGDAYEADFVHAKIEVLAGPLTADGKLDQLRWGPIWARNGEPPRPGVPPAPVASAMTLQPAANLDLEQMSLIPVSNQTPEGGQGLGPGHYVERSGVKESGGCGGARYSDTYKLSTRPIAPGRIITNFHYELVGDNRCDPGRGAWHPASGTCEVVTDRPDRKTVRFELYSNEDSCFPFTAFAQDGSHHDQEIHGVSPQQGAVTRSEMVLSYDVQ